MAIIRESVEQGGDAQVVAAGSEAGDRAAAYGGDERAVAYLLAGHHIAQVYLHHGQPDGCYRVGYGERGVGVGSGIEHYAEVGVIEAHAVDHVDDVALMVALSPFQLHDAIIFIGEPLGYAFQGVGAVDARFAVPEQVEVRTIDYEYFLHFFSSTLCVGGS